MIYLYDFDDSFTYNVYDDLNYYLSDLYGEVKVLHWRELCGLINWDTFSSFDLVVLGPGPGHPSDYKSLHQMIQKLVFESRAPKFFGVCLGHQLVFSALGHEVKRIENPVHGQAITLEYPLDWGDFFQDLKANKFQRYHSLGVFLDKTKVIESQALWSCDNQLWGSYIENKGVTYQFHPESIGTSFPEDLYRPLRSFSLS